MKEFKIGDFVEVGFGESVYGQSPSTKVEGL